MTDPVIYAAAYVLLMGQPPQAPPVPGLGGDAVPAHLQGLGRDCQFDMQPRHVDHDQGRGNHLTIRLRPAPAHVYYDRHRRHHHHRGWRFDDQP